MNDFLYKMSSIKMYLQAFILSLADSAYVDVGNPFLRWEMIVCVHTGSFQVFNKKPYYASQIKRVQFR